MPEEKEELKKPVVNTDDDNTCPVGFIWDADQKKCIEDIGKQD